MNEASAELVEEFAGLKDGRRCITDVSELGSLEGEIFKFRFCEHKDAESQITELKRLHRELRAMQPGLSNAKIVSDYKRALPSELRKPCSFANPRSGRGFGPV